MDWSVLHKYLGSGQNGHKITQKCQQKEDKWCGSLNRWDEKLKDSLSEKGWGVGAQPID